jgi:hypothetical protein
MSALFRSRRGIACAAAIVIVGAAAAVLCAQQRFDIFILAYDSKGFAVTDLKADELHFREDDKPGTVVRLDRFRWPVKVTVLVDNGRGGAAGVGTGTNAGDGGTSDCSSTNIVHYRNGLKKLFETLPGDIEVTLIATAPNPRYLVRPTTDQVQIQKGVSLLVPDTEFIGRFVDSLSEYTQRLDLEFKQLTREERPPYVPVLVVIASSSLDGSQFELTRASRMMESLRNYGVATNFIMVSPCSRAAVNLDEGTPVLIAKKAQEITRGRYDAIAHAGTSRLASLLPEIGQQITARHLKQTLQYRVTLERPAGATGNFGNTGMSLSREGVQYVMSLDGTYP